MYYIRGHGIGWDGLLRCWESVMSSSFLAFVFRRVFGLRLWRYLFIGVVVRVNILSV